MGAGVLVEVDRVDEQSWDALSNTFADFNLYQSWPYEAVNVGEANVSRLVLKDGARVIAAVQVRMMRVRCSRTGVAYVRWGPLWRSRHGEPDLQALRQAVAALRREYVERRGFVLRMVPRSAADADGGVREILEHEGFALRHTGDETLILDLRPGLDELHRGVHHKWRYHLNKARKNNLQAVEGEEEALFLQFERIYAQMLERKRFATFADVRQLKTIQQRLPPAQRMRVFLASVDGEACAGGICSALGDTALYLFGATSNTGLDTYGSYLVHWNMLAWAKARGCERYDLNGINRARNAGGYQFKTQLAHTHGDHVSFVGQFDAYPNLAARALVAAADPLRMKLREARLRLARFA